jgi:hypothetical protein
MKIAFQRVKDSKHSMDESQKICLDRTSDQP